MGELAARILGIKSEDEEDTKWGPLAALTPEQDLIFRDFVKAHEEFETRMKLEDMKIHEEYQRRMNLSIRTPQSIGPLIDFQVIEYSGRKYVRWEQGASDAKVDS